MIPKCQHTEEHCHAICNECYKNCGLRMIDFVSGSMKCCFCLFRDAVRWVRK